ncbi:site-specific DNA-methyltransferase [bacterium]|nr:site-specific DNA-methyltransferase [bacterium]
MSRVDGKQKNWGSRSGRATKKPKKEEQSNADKLINNGLSHEMLELAASDPTEFQTIAQKILEKRNTIAEEAMKQTLKKVFSTKLGTLYNTDCIKLLKTKIEDGSIDCVFADPPFNLSKNYGKGVKDSIKEEDYLEWTRLWLDLCCDKLKDGGSLFVYNIPRWGSYIASYLNQRLSFRNWITVDLTLSMPIPNKLYPSHYSLLYYVKGGRPNHFSPPRLPLKTCIRCGQEQNDYGGYKMKMNPEGLNLRDVWTDIPPVRHKKHKSRDANELSLKLMDRVVELSTKRGDLVFDPFGGAGTTFVASELAGRKWIGAELGDCTPIVERFNNLDNDKENLKKYRANLNTLFTDKDILNRYKHGLKLDNYKISREQIDRALPENDLF